MVKIFQIIHVGKQKFHAIFGIYLAFLCLIAPINLHYFDTYYYWEWSRHLDISYYDGSPMIAYFIKLSTLLFGDTLFALSVVGIVTATLTSLIIFKTARLFLQREASYIAATLWLFTPLVTGDIIKQTTYDTPLTLFWALTLYFAAIYIKYNKTKDLYFVGICIGLMMLSKYSGIVLVISLLIFTGTTRYRFLFKSPHFYLAVGSAIILFSPVIFWNQQHHWQSFVYQLTSHKTGNLVNPLKGLLQFLTYRLLPLLNIMLLPPFIYRLNRKNKHAGSDDQALIPYLCYVICLTFIGFYGLLSINTVINRTWLAQFLITSALLGGYCFQAVNLRKLTYLLLIVYAAISVCMLLLSTSMYNITTRNQYDYYQQMQALNKTYAQLPSAVITTGWSEARMLFFLKNKPQVFTLNCGPAQNQYAHWDSASFKNMQNIWYIDTVDRIGCIEKYVDHCRKLSSGNKIVVYACTAYSKKNGG